MTDLRVVTDLEVRLKRAQSHSEERLGHHLEDDEDLVELMMGFALDVAEYGAEVDETQQREAVKIWLSTAE